MSCTGPNLRADPWAWVALPVTLINVLFLKFYFDQYSLQKLSNKQGKTKDSKQE